LTRLYLSFSEKMKKCIDWYASEFETPLCSEGGH